MKPVEAGHETLVGHIDFGCTDTTQREPWRDTLNQNAVSDKDDLPRRTAVTKAAKEGY